MSTRIAILGGGVMGETLLSALLGAGHAAAFGRPLDPRNTVSLSPLGPHHAACGARNTVLLALQEAPAPAGGRERAAAFA